MDRNFYNLAILIFAFSMLSSLSFAASYKTYEECFQKCPADYAAGTVWGCNEAYCGLFPKASELNQPPAEPETPAVTPNIAIPGMECQSKCVNEQVACAKPCNDNFPSCTMACPDGDAYDACWQVCMDGKTSCENACLGPKYTACMKPCFIAQGIPKVCVDKYDTLNQEAFMQCLTSLGTMPTVPTTPETCVTDGKCDSANGETPDNCPQDCMGEICYDDIDNDGNMYIDCEDDACKSSPVCGPLTGKVYMNDLGGEKLLKGVTMFARWTTKDGTVGESPYFYSDDSGQYKFDDSELHAVGTKNIQIFSKLYDFDNRIGISEGGTPVQQKTEISKKNWAGGAPQDVVFEDVNKEDDTHPRDGAKVYFHTKESDDFILGFSSARFGFEASDIHSTRKSDPKFAYHMGHAAPADIANIFYGTETSRYQTMEAPTNREYHENAHHMMNVVYGYMPPRHTDDSNHGGIHNGCSSDAYVEGFAEFTSLVTNRNTAEYKRCGGQEAYRYCVGDTDINIEQNWQATRWEEIAVAGILWDIYDSKDINGGTDDDSVSLDFATMWKTLSSDKTFTVYDKAPATRKIRYVPDIYEAFKADGVDVNGLNGIFKSHGYYYHDDSTGNDTYGLTLWVHNTTKNTYQYRQELTVNDTDYFTRH